MPFARSWSLWLRHTECACYRALQLLAAAFLVGGADGPKQIGVGDQTQKDVIIDHR